MMNIRLCLLLLCFISYRNTYAQSLTKEVETSIENLNKAMISKDKPMLENLTADELSYGHSTAVVQTKSEFVNDILSGPTDFSKIDITNQTINLAGNMAIVRNFTSISGTSKGMPLELKIGVLMIWRKLDNSWKLLARQGFKLP
jgi:ketosteroid isomerase-like protein